MRAAGPALLLAALAAAAGAGAAEAPRRRALVIGIDGLTGPQLHQRVWRDAAAPAIRALMERGSFAACESRDDPRCARAHSGPRELEDYRWSTAPGWASVVTGVDSPRHGVRGNGFDGQREFARTSRQHPSFFKRLKDAGFVTAAGGVGAFLSSRDGDAIDTGILDYECGIGDGAPRIGPADTASCNLDRRRADDLASDQRDEALAAWLVERIGEGRADVLMGVFDEVDEAGHRGGFGDERGYLEAISAADALVARLVAAVERSAGANGEEWLVLLTADHGGHADWLFGGSHDRRMPDDQLVPFVVARFGGAAVLPLVPPVTQMDVHPTVLTWFGQAPGDVDGAVQGLAR